MNFQILLLPLQLLLCVVAADFLSGLLHWLEDTYGSYRSPAFLQRWIVIDNIAHHRMPAKFTRATWWSRNNILTMAGGLAAVLAVASGLRDWQIYVLLALASQSNEIHAWAHRKNVPALVAALQWSGILQSRAHHGEHHRSPYAIRFCTTTNFLNPVLDRLKFWRILEAVAAYGFGVAPKRTTDLRGGY